MDIISLYALIIIQQLHSYKIFLIYLRYFYSNSLLYAGGGLYNYNRILFPSRHVDLCLTSLPLITCFLLFTANQRTVFQSRYAYQPIRAQYSTPKLGSYCSPTSPGIFCSLGDTLILGPSRSLLQLSRRLLGALHGIVHYLIFFGVPFS